MFSDKFDQASKVKKGSSLTVFNVWPRMNPWYYFFYDISFSWIIYLLLWRSLNNRFATSFTAIGMVLGIILGLFIHKPAFLILFYIPLCGIIGGMLISYLVTKKQDDKPITIQARALKYEGAPIVNIDNLWSFISGLYIGFLGQWIIEILFLIIKF